MKRLLLLALLIVPACADLDAPDAEPVYSRTIVNVTPAGATEFTVDFISAEEQRAEIAAREHGSAARDFGVDSGCSQASLWVFDGTNRTGNEVCFYGKGSTLLSLISRWKCTPTGSCFTLTWDQAVRSYWSGSQPGFFAPTVGGPVDQEGFGAYQRVDVAGYRAQHADVVALE